MTQLSDEQILEKTNQILSFCQLQPRFCSINDIQENISSICVAILERLLQQKLANINRNPKCDLDYINNAKIFLQNLRNGFLKINLSQYVTPKRVCDGDKIAISEILNVLTKLVNLLSHIRLSTTTKTTTNDNDNNNNIQDNVNNYDADDDISDSDINQKNNNHQIPRNAEQEEEEEEEEEETNEDNEKEISLISSRQLSTTETSEQISSSSLETETADRSPIYRSAGFNYHNNIDPINDLQQSSEKPKKIKNNKKLRRKISYNNMNINNNNNNKRRKILKKRPSSARTMSSLSYSTKSMKSMSSQNNKNNVIGRGRKKQMKMKRNNKNIFNYKQRKSDEEIYRQILSSKLSLKHKNDKLYKYSMKQMKESKNSINSSKINYMNNKENVDENRLIRIIQKQQKEKLRSDLRWLERVENELERELLLRRIKQKSDEEIAIERVEAEAKKLEKEYLRSYYKEYKRKFEILRKDLESKTKSIQHFFKDQYNVLQDEKEALKKFNHSQSYSEKVELSKIKQQLKSKRKSQLNQLCQKINTLNLNNPKDLEKLNKMIKKMVHKQ